MPLANQVLPYKNSTESRVSLVTERDGSAASLLFPVVVNKVIIRLQHVHHSFESVEEVIFM